MDKLLHDSDITIVMLLYTYTLCIVVSHNVKEVLTQLSQSYNQPLSVPLLMSSDVKDIQKLILHKNG